MTKVHRPTVFDKYTVTLADLVALGAATSGVVPLDTLPADSIVTHVFVRPVTALVGPSLSAATARVTTASKNFGTAYDVFQAVGAAVLDYDDEGQYIAPTATALRLSMTTTGANLSALTAGQIDVYVEYLVL